MADSFWSGRSVLITGHTGFKGAWLSLYLEMLGAKVTGYALPAEPAPNLFRLLDLEKRIRSVEGDVRDLDTLQRTLADCKPEIVLHLAAQSLVRDSYRFPVDTYATNIMGTVNLLEAVRHCDTVQAVVNVTTDKCYDNQEWIWPYRENDRLGGRDPYSSSKACSEMVTESYRHSFFGDERPRGELAIASARAGNVIGGGDWSRDRLVPDIFRAVQEHQVLAVRNPLAVRPWQHVLEPLSGYLLLARQLVQGASVAEAWNFGPDAAASCSVGRFLELVQQAWPDTFTWQQEEGASNPHESRLLTLDSSKAVIELGWGRKLELDDAVTWTVDWYQAHANEENMPSVTEAQINEYQSL